MKDSLFDSFLEVEEKYSFFDLEYRNVHFWYLIRLFFVYDKVRELKTGTARVYVQNASLKSKWNTFIKIIHNIMKYGNKSKIDCEILLSKTDRKVSTVDGLINPTTYTIEEHYKPYIHLNAICSGLEDRCDSDNSILILKVYLAKVLGRILKKNKNLPNSIIELIRKRIKENINVELSKDFLSDNIYNEVIGFEIAYRHFDRLIRKNNFKVIFIEDGYCTYHYALIAVAKKRKIPIIELQHGIIGRYHLAYNFANSNRENPYCVDEIFFYGEYWKNSCRVSNSCKKSVIGFPYLETAMKNYIETNPDFNSILVFTGDYTKELIDLTIQLEKLIKDTPYNIYVKFHPSEINDWREKYPQLINTTINVIEDKYVSVYKLLSESKHCIGVNSTVMFEATYFQNNIYLFRCEGGKVSPYVKDLQGTPGVFSFLNAHELKKEIEKNNKKDTYSENDDKYYARHATSKLFSCIDELLDEDKKKNNSIQKRI